MLLKSQRVAFSGPIKRSSNATSSIKWHISPVAARRPLPLSACAPSRRRHHAAACFLPRSFCCFARACFSTRGAREAALGGYSGGGAAAAATATAGAGAGAGRLTVGSTAPGVGARAGAGADDSAAAGAGTAALGAALGAGAGDGVSAAAGVSMAVLGAGAGVGDSAAGPDT